MEITANMNFSIIRKPWGREYLAYRNAEVAVWVLEMYQGKATSLHAHPRKNTAFVVLKGTVQIELIRGEPIRLTGLDKVNVFRGRFHRVRALSAGVVLLEVESPDDKRNIVRLEDDHWRVGLPIEEPTEPLDNTCLQLTQDTFLYEFSRCRISVLFSDEGIDPDYYMNENHVLVTLAGGLEHGLLSPGEAIDGFTAARLVTKFPVVPGSLFLHIKTE